MTHKIKLLLLSTEPTNVDMALELITETGTGKDWLEELFIAYQFVQNKKQKEITRMLIQENGSSELQAALAVKYGIYSATDKKINEYLHKLSQDTGMDILRMAFAIFRLTSNRQTFSGVKFIFENGESWMKKEVIKKMIDSNGAVHLGGYRYDLQSLPEELGEFPEIRQLILEKPNFRKFPDVALKLTGLEVLNISLSEINELPEDLSNLKNLRHLMLDNCCFQQFPEVICTLKELESLSLENTSSEVNAGFKTIPPGISSLQNLKYLNLSGNPIGQLPQQLLELNALNILHIRNTALISLPGNIDKLVNCRELLTSDNTYYNLPRHPYKNTFTDLPEAILRMKNLEILEVSGKCNIPDEVRKMKKSTDTWIQVID